MGTPQGSPCPFSVGPLPDAFIGGTEGYIEQIQKLDKTLSRETILKAIDAERAKSAGMLTQEAAAALLYKSLLEPEEPKDPGETEEDEPQGPPGFVPGFSTAAGQTIGTALEIELTTKLVEATGLSKDHFKVEEKSEGVSVRAAKFLGDRWSQANQLLEGNGFDYVKGRDDEKYWVMSKPKAKEQKPPKKATQEALNKPKTIREAEAILIDKFGPTILKSVTVTEDGKTIDVEPGSKLPQKQQEAITALLARYGGTLTDTGIPPGYVWVIPK